MAILSTDVVSNPLELAQYASIVLSGDKGIGNEIMMTDDGFDVVVDNGDIIRFIREPCPNCNGTGQTIGHEGKCLACNG